MNITMQREEKKKNYYRLGLQGGRLERMVLTEDFRLSGSGGGTFYYLAPVFDTQEMSESFHRFCLEGEFYKCKRNVLVAATDRDLRDVLEEESLSFLEISELMMSCDYKRRVNQDDFLLHELTGRYLWILVTVTAAQLDSGFTIEGFSVVFPKSSFIEYLPELYQNEKDTFFYRYMAALQSLYTDLEEEVKRVPSYLDYHMTSDENVTALSAWVGLQGERILYTPDQLRSILEDLGQIQSGKGTIYVLQKILQLMTGKEVTIIEYFKRNDWMRYSDLKEEFDILYGSDPETFTCMLDFTKDRTEEIPSVSSIMNLIDQLIPFGLQYNLVFLQETYNMDMHCYLDVNSHLSTPESADTTGFVLGGNYVLA